MEVIRRPQVLGQVLIAGTAIEQAPSVPNIYTSSEYSLEHWIHCVLKQALDNMKNSQLQVDSVCY